jgi:hypothetical protein
MTKLLTVVVSSKQAESLGLTHTGSATPKARRDAPQAAGRGVGFTRSVVAGRPVAVGRPEMDNHAVAGWSIQMGRPSVGCISPARRRPYPRYVSADTRASHWDRLEVGGGRIRRAAPYRGNQQCCGATAFNFGWPSDRGGSALRKSVRRRPTRITRARGEPVTFASRESIALTVAKPAPVASRGCASSSCAGCRAASPGPIRRSNRSWGVRGLRGRDVELQQDSKRHVLISWGRSLVDWQPRTCRPGRPLSHRSSLDV